MDADIAQQRRKFYLAKAREAEEHAALLQDVRVRGLVQQIGQSWRLIAADVNRQIH